MPQIVGDWRLIERIGEGGMGVVYRASHGVLPGEYAVKQIHPRWLGDEEIRARFIREAALSAALNHPHIIRCWIPLSDGDQIYLPMELLRGAPLSARLQGASSPPSIAEAVGLIRQAAEALGYVHARGIIHRDIKPSNLFICDKGDVKILDFGLAKELGGQSITATQATMGTAEYVAPECLAGQRPSPAADVYALGLVLYRLLVGAAAIALPSREILPMMRALTAAHDAGLPRPSVARPEIPAWLDDLTFEMLQTDPSARLKDGAAVAARMYPRPEEETRLDLLSYTQAEAAGAADRPRRGLFGLRSSKAAAAEMEALEAARRGLEARLSAALSQIDALTADREASRAQAQALAAQIEAQAGLDPELSAQLSEAQAALEASRRHATRLEADLSEAQRRAARLEADLTEATRGQARLREALEALQAKHEALLVEIEALRAAPITAIKAPIPVKPSAPPARWGEITEDLRAAHPSEQPATLRLDEIEWIKVEGGRRIPTLYVARTPITVAQYRRAVEAGAVAAPKTGEGFNWGRPDHEDHPINGVSWAEASAFAAWAGGRLPSDAEWAFIASSRGARQRYPWGEGAPLRFHAAFNRKEGTEPVGTHSMGSTAEGVTDMAGNVWEWTLNPDRKGLYSLRGGSWRDEAKQLEINNMLWSPASTQAPHVGLRVVREAP
ncbi:protein kinase [Myxococcota bacterium]|nr:protein kinase [Myxococcota bacterium]MBU1429653.1 protein kinase [Myxococcota bacterium]